MLEGEALEWHSMEGKEETELVGLELSESDESEPGVKCELRPELETVDEIELVELDDVSLLTGVGWTACCMRAGRLATVSGPPNR